MITEADTGRTITVERGARVTVVLHSTYWTLGTPSGGVLVAASPPSASPSPGCVPGSGCGIVTEAFRAAMAGQAELRASRGSCGEARRCVGAEGVFVVTVAVR